MNLSPRERKEFIATANDSGCSTEEAEAIVSLVSFLEDYDSKKGIEEETISFSNALILDNRLSFASRGMLFCLLSYGDDDEWDGTIEKLAALIGESLETTLTCLNELVKFGYAKEHAHELAFYEIPPDLDDGTYQTETIIHGDTRVYKKVFE